MRYYYDRFGNLQAYDDLSKYQNSFNSFNEKYSTPTSNVSDEDKVKDYANSFNTMFDKPTQTTQNTDKQDDTTSNTTERTKRYFDTKEEALKWANSNKDLAKSAEFVIGEKPTTNLNLPESMTKPKWENNLEKAQRGIDEYMGNLKAGNTQGYNGSIPTLIQPSSLHPEQTNVANENKDGYLFKKQTTAMQEDDNVTLGDKAIGVGATAGEFALRGVQGFAKAGVALGNTINSGLVYSAELNSRIQGAKADLIKALGQAVLPDNVYNATLGNMEYGYRYKSKFLRGWAESGRQYLTEHPDTIGTKAFEKLDREYNKLVQNLDRYSYATDNADNLATMMGDSFGSVAIGVAGANFISGSKAVSSLFPEGSIDKMGNIVIKDTIRIPISVFGTTFGKSAPQVLAKLGSFNDANLAEIVQSALVPLSQATVETLTESMFSMFSFWGKSVGGNKFTDEFINRLASKFTNSYLRVGTMLLLDAGGEAVEEFTGGILNYIMDNLIDKGAKLFGSRLDTSSKLDLEEIGNEMILASISAGLSGSFNTTVSYVTQYNNINSYLKKNGIELTNEQKSELKQGLLNSISDENYQGSELFTAIVDEYSSNQIADVTVTLANKESKKNNGIALDNETRTAIYNEAFDKAQKLRLLQHVYNEAVETFTKENNRTPTEEDSTRILTASANYVANKVGNKPIHFNDVINILNQLYETETDETATTKPVSTPVQETVPANETSQVEPKAETVKPSRKAKVEKPVEATKVETKSTEVKPVEVKVDTVKDVVTQDKPIEVKTADEVKTTKKQATKTAQNSKKSDEGIKDIGSKTTKLDGEKKPKTTKLDGKKTYGARVRDSEGNEVTLRDESYPSKQAFIRDIHANGYKIIDNSVMEMDKFNEYMDRGITNKDLKKGDYYTEKSLETEKAKTQEQPKAKETEAKPKTTSEVKPKTTKLDGEKKAKTETLSTKDTSNLRYSIKGKEVKSLVDKVTNLTLARYYKRRADWLANSSKVIDIQDIETDIRNEFVAEALKTLRGDSRIAMKNTILFDPNGSASENNYTVKFEDVIEDMLANIQMALQREGREGINSNKAIRYMFDLDSGILRKVSDDDYQVNYEGEKFLPLYRIKPNQDKAMKLARQIEQAVDYTKGNVQSITITNKGVKINYNEDVIDPTKLGRVEINANELFDEEGNVLVENLDEFRDKYNDEVRSKTLLVVHNMSIYNLFTLLNQGGKDPMPSLAIFDALNQVFNECGDVTVVFDKNTIDPDIDPRNQLYDRDIYSPTRRGKENAIVDRKYPNMREMREIGRSSVKIFLDEFKKGNAKDKAELIDGWEKETFSDLSNYYDEDSPVYKLEKDMANYAFEAVPKLLEDEKLRQLLISEDTSKAESRIAELLDPNLYDYAFEINQENIKIFKEAINKLGNSRYDYYRFPDSRDYNKYMEYQADFLDEIRGKIYQGLYMDLENEKPTNFIRAVEDYESRYKLSEKYKELKAFARDAILNIQNGTIYDLRRLLSNVVLFDEALKNEGNIKKLLESGEKLYSTTGAMSNVLAGDLYSQTYIDTYIEETLEALRQQPKARRKDIMLDRYVTNRSGNEIINLGEKALEDVYADIIRGLYKVLPTMESVYENQSRLQNEERTSTPKSYHRLERNFFIAVRQIAKILQQAGYTSDYYDPSLGWDNLDPYNAILDDVVHDTLDTFLTTYLNGLTTEANAVTGTFDEFESKLIERFTDTFNKAYKNFTDNSSIRLQEDDINNMRTVLQFSTSMLADVITSSYEDSVTRFYEAKPDRIVDLTKEAKMVLLPSSDYYDDDNDTLRSVKVLLREYGIPFEIYNSDDEQSRGKAERRQTNLMFRVNPTNSEILGRIKGASKLTNEFVNAITDTYKAVSGKDNITSTSVKRRQTIRNIAERLNEQIIKRNNLSLSEIGKVIDEIGALQTVNKNGKRVTIKNFLESKKTVRGYKNDWIAFKNETIDNIVNVSMNYNPNIREAIVWEKRIEDTTKAINKDEGLRKLIETRLGDQYTIEDVLSGNVEATISAKTIVEMAEDRKTLQSLGKMERDKYFEAVRTGKIDGGRYSFMKWRKERIVSGKDTVNPNYIDNKQRVTQAGIQKTIEDEVLKRKIMHNKVRTSLGEVMGFFNILTNDINLTKSIDPDSTVHETGHFATKEYLKSLTSNSIDNPYVSEVFEDLAEQSFGDIYDTASKRLDELENRVDKYNERMDRYDTEISGLENTLAKTKKASERAEIQNEIMKLEESKEYIKSLRDKLESQRDYLDNLADEQHNIKIMEGLAEFYRLYISDHDRTVNIFRNGTKAQQIWLSEFETELAINDELREKTIKLIFQYETLLRNITNPEYSLSNVSIGEHTDKKAKRKTLDGIMYNIADDKWDIKNLAKTYAKRTGRSFYELNQMENIYNRVRLSQDISSRALSVYKDGLYVPDPHNNLNMVKKMDGVVEIFDEMFDGISEKDKARRKRLEEMLYKHLYGLRAIDYHFSGLETNDDINDTIRKIERGEIIQANGTVTEDEARVLRASDKIYEYSRALLEYARDNGLITQEELDGILKTNQFYIPMARVLDEEYGVNTVGGRNTDTTNLLKSRTGSLREIIDFRETLLVNTGRILKNVEWNNIARTLEQMEAKAQQSKNTMADVYIVTDGEVNYKGEITADKIIDRVNNILASKEIDYQLTPIDFGANMKLFGRTFSDADNLTVGFIDSNGKHKSILFKDKFVYDSLYAYEKLNSSINTLLNVVGLPTSVLRMGATGLNLEFVLTNMLSDSLGAFVYGEDFAPIVDTVRGLYYYVTRDLEETSEQKQNKLDWILYQQSGGTMGGQLAYAREELQKNLSQLFKDNAKDLMSNNRDDVFKAITNIAKGIKNGVNGGIDLISAITEASEQATRFAFFKKEYHNNLELVRQGKITSQAEALMRASIATKQSTIDFARHGAIMKYFNRLFAFSNARIQGAYRFGESLYQAPKQVMFKTLLLAGISLLLKYASKAIAGDKYDELNYQKRTDNFVLFTNNTNGGIITIRKPQGGIRDIINVIEVLSSIMDGSITGDEAISELKDIVGDSIASNLPIQVSPFYSFKRNVANALPDAFKPLLENAFNVDSYYGGTIVNTSSYNQADKRLWYNPNTSSTARVVGNILHQSPAQLENLVNGYTAGLGKGLLTLMDMAVEAIDDLTVNKLPTAPSPSASEFVFARRFTADYNKNSTSVSRVYDKQAELDNWYKLNKLSDNEVASLSQAEQDEYAEKYIEYKRYTNTKNVLSNLNKTANNIRNDLTLSGKEKTQKLNEINEIKTDVARNLLGKTSVNNTPDVYEFYPDSATKFEYKNVTLTPTADDLEDFVRIAKADFDKRYLNLTRNSSFNRKSMYEQYKDIEEARSNAKAYAKKQISEKIYKERYGN